MLKIGNKVRIKENITELNERYSYYVGKKTEIVSKCKNQDKIYSYRVFNIYLPSMYLEKVIENEN